MNLYLFCLSVLSSIQKATKDVKNISVMNFAIGRYRFSKVLVGRTHLRAKEVAFEDLL